MKLKTYLHRKKLSQKQFAVKLGDHRGWPVSEGAVSNWLSDRHTPGLGNQLAIMYCTDGLVKPADW